MERLIREDYKTFISGGALGFDQDAADVVFNLSAVYAGVELVMAIPFAGYESRWPKSSIQKYTELLQLADRVVVVSEGGYASWKLFKRNEWMLERSSVVVALWDGKPSGGTYDTINKAETMGKRIVRIDPRPLERVQK